MPDSNAQTLCKACGLCCSGHLFSWVRLNANELDKAEALGLNVIRNDPRQRGFLQPCPVWQSGVCTVYTSPDYPRSCAKYKCIVLRKLLDEEIDFHDAMNQIQETLSLIREVENLLPNASIISFREQLITHKENLEKLDKQKYTQTEKEFLQKAGELLNLYESRFGVDDFIDYEK
ncbi:MAG: hypothetical protein JNK81_12730 [Anaerolineales bacterium]|nr:hypothetical protein [Anaerolineales bacterium]